jgi:predicted nucleic acid-binding protein
MSADLDFIDTNPFVYVFDRSDDEKRQRAMRIVAEGLRSGAVISYQVVQETLNVLTRKTLRAPSPADSREFLEDVLVPLWRVHPSPELYQRGLDIQGKYRLSFYDSLIVAAAVGAGCTRLLTEDLQHGQIIEGVRVENPFL